MTAGSAFGATKLRSPAIPKTFHPRLGNAMGVLPTVTKDGGFNTQNLQFNPNQNGVLTPVVYHGGPTMTGGVTVHAIFWTPSGTETSFPNGPNGLTTPGMISQFYTDVGAASTGTSGSSCTAGSCNMFSVEPQYG